MRVTGQFSKDYLITVAQALFVTFLWSSSWVIIKFGLQELPPLIFSGLRYSCASIILVILVLMNSDHRASVAKLDRRNWLLILFYGVVFIFITQGAMFVALDLLPAITVSLMLNMTIFAVIVLSVLLLKEEVPTFFQLLAILAGFAGIFIYFYPVAITSDEFLGLIIISVGMLANALASILGRIINRAKTTSPIVVTALSMSAGSVMLLLAGLLLEGMPVLSLVSIIFILWLSVVNTVVAFTIWNKTMQRLRAVDSTLINSTMLPQTVLLALVFLGERPELLDWLGLTLLAASVIVVQVSQARKENTKEV